MATIVFDSYSLAKRLKEAGFTEKQAEMLIDAAKDAMTLLATKDDLEALKKDLTIRFGVMLAAAIGMIVGLLRLWV